MSGKPFVADLAAHVAAICARHGIEVVPHSSGGRAHRKSRRVAIRPVRSPTTYAIALHEIGHILGGRQWGTRIDKEVGAWEWARTAALVWTPGMDGAMRRSLGSYLRWIDRRPDMKRPPPGHPVWSLLFNAPGVELHPMNPTPGTSD